MKKRKKTAKKTEKFAWSGGVHTMTAIQVSPGPLLGNSIYLRSGEIKKVRTIEYGLTAPVISSYSLPRYNQPRMIWVPCELTQGSVPLKALP